MTIKEQREIRKRRQRMLMTPYGTFAAASAVIRKRLSVQTVTSYPFCGGKREAARRARQIAAGTLRIA